MFCNVPQFFLMICKFYCKLLMHFMHTSFQVCCIVHALIGLESSEHVLRSPDCGAGASMNDLNWVGKRLAQDLPGNGVHVPAQVAKQP